MRAVSKVVYLRRCVVSNANFLRHIDNLLLLFVILLFIRGSLLYRYSLHCYSVFTHKIVSHLGGNPKTKPYKMQ